MMEPATVIQTPAFAHHGVAWSPFFENKLAIASSANYGLIGNGRLHLVALSSASANSVGQPPNLIANTDRIFETQDALFDLCWSEIHENQVITASGDGSVRLWDITLSDHPIRVWREHTREVYGVHWSTVNKHVFCSGSWDGSIRIWNPERPHSLKAIPAHQNHCIYQALFSPHEADVIASCGSDGQAKLYDLRVPSALPYPSAPAITIQAHPGEVLTLDWNKWQPYILATGGIDRTIRVWDCRMVKTHPSPSSGSTATANCTKELVGHEYAVRKVQWSNFSPDKLASASYDMSCRIWSTNTPPGAPSLQAIYDKHTEFVVACAWSLNDATLLASSSWDCRTHIWRAPL